MRHAPSSGYEDSSLNYVVTWRSYEKDGPTHERRFTNRDHGWDFYQDMQRSANAHSMTWEHVPA